MLNYKFDPLPERAVEFPIHVFMPLALLVGIYVMNFENMPELHSHYGYFVLLGVMSTIVAGLLY